MERPAAVARELTKLHEDIRRGTLGELATYYRENPPRGEVTVVIGGRSEPAEGALADHVPDAATLARELAGTGTPAAIAKELSRRLGISRQEAYRLVTEDR